MSARAGLLAELHRVAADWQRVLPTLALQLLQVPRAQWHTVGAVQAMVTNLAAEREAVVGFLHTLIDEVRQMHLSRFDLCCRPVVCVYRASLLSQQLIAPLHCIAPPGLPQQCCRHQGAHGRQHTGYIHP